MTKEDRDIKVVVLAVNLDRVAMSYGTPMGLSGADIATSLMMTAVKMFLNEGVDEKVVIKAAKDCVSAEKQIKRGAGCEN